MGRIIKYFNKINNWRFKNTIAGVKQCTKMYKIQSNSNYVLTNGKYAELDANEIRCMNFEM